MWNLCLICGCHKPLYGFPLNKGSLLGVKNQCKCCGNKAYKLKAALKKPIPMYVTHKKCPSCESCLPSEEFYVVNGKLAGWCKVCSKAKNKVTYAKHRPRILEKAREYVKNNQEKIKAYRKDRYDKNTDEIKAKNRKWAMDNREERSKVNKERRNELASFTRWAHRLVVEDTPKLREKDDLWVKCKKCGSEFRPSNGECEQRIRSLTRTDYGSINFYCSADCKNSCDVFGMRINRRSELAGNKKLRNCQTTSKKQLVGIQADTDGSSYCERCGDITDRLELHHTLPISEYKDKANNVSTMILLCHKCHVDTHRQCK